MSCSAWDQGDEDLDGPRSARIWPFSKYDYTCMVLSFGRNKKVSPMTLLALLIRRCWVYTAWQCLLGFRRAPRVQSATHYNSPLLLLIPSGGLVIRHPLVPLFIFTPVGSEAMNHTCPCTTLNRAYFTHERDLALYVLSRPLKAVKFSVACR